MVCFCFVTCIFNCREDFNMEISLCDTSSRDYNILWELAESFIRGEEEDDENAEKSETKKPKKHTFVSAKLHHIYTCFNSEFQLPLHPICSIHVLHSMSDLTNIKSLNFGYKISKILVTCYARNWFFKLTKIFKPNRKLKTDFAPLQLAYQNCMSASVGFL